MIARSPVLLAAEDGTSVMQFSLAIALVSEPSTDGPKIVGCAALEYYPRSASALLTYAKSRNRAPLTLTSYREAQSRNRNAALWSGIWSFAATSASAASGARYLPRCAARSSTCRAVPCVRACAIRSARRAMLDKQLALHAGSAGNRCCAYGTLAHPFLPVSFCPIPANATPHATSAARTGLRCSSSATAALSATMRPWPRSHGSSCATPPNICPGTGRQMPTESIRVPHHWKSGYGY